MRSLILLTIVGIAAAQRFNPFFQGGRQQQRQQQRQPQRGGNQLSCQSSVVDDCDGSSMYHFSWRHARGQTFVGSQARSYCQRLGQGWHAVDINDGRESQFVNAVIEGERQEYIWTGGVKSGRGRFSWSDGSGVAAINWSHTGGLRTRQPDNRDGNEDCLGVLNNFYGDDVKWHDVACHHKKPVICERKA